MQLLNKFLQEYILSENIAYCMAVFSLFFFQFMNNLNKESWLPWEKVHSPYLKLSQYIKLWSSNLNAGTENGAIPYKIPQPYLGTNKTVLIIFF